MALNLVAASSQYLTSTSANAFLSYPFTVLATASPSSAAAAQYIFCSENNLSAVINGFRLRAAGDAGSVARITVGDGTSTNAVSTSTTYTAGTYQKYTYLGTSATSRSVLLQNAGLGTSATNLTPTGIDNATIGAGDLLTVKTGFFDGQIAHLAGWNVILSAAELAMYQAGVSPMNIRRASLLFYLPFNTDISDLTGNTTWTNVGTATIVATGPGVSIPRFWLQ